MTRPSNTRRFRCAPKMAGAVIGKGGHNIQKLRTEVCFDKILIVDIILFRFFFCYHYNFFWVENIFFLTSWSLSSIQSQKKTFSHPLKVEKKEIARRHEEKCLF